eukprot:3828712-Alexandrium_andersonii.AAC.1
MSHTYRRWAAMRLRDLSHWVEGWALPELYGGMRGKDASMAAWSTAVELEWAHMQKCPVVSLTADLFKCFDLISRQLLCLVALRAGVPASVLQAWF